MKTNILVSILVAALLVAAAGIGAYFLLPEIIRANTADLAMQVKQANDRLQKLESYVASAEQAGGEGQLKIGADAQTIVNTVNRQISRVDALDAKEREEIRRIEEGMVQLKNKIDQGLKNQDEASKKIDAATKSLAHDARFRGILANIKRQILKARVEISDRNLGNAKNELNLIDAQLDRASALAAAPEKNALGESREMLQKVKADLDTNLASAANRLDLLWHELEKLPEQQ